jgi:hypothetical protein
MVPGREARQGRQTGAGSDGDSGGSHRSGGDGGSKGSGSGSDGSGDGGSGSDGSADSGSESSGSGGEGSDGDDSDDESEIMADARRLLWARLPDGAQVRLLERAAGRLASEDGGDIAGLGGAVGTILSAELVDDDPEVESAWWYDVYVERGSQLGLSDTDCADGLHVSADAFEELRLDEDGAWYARHEFAAHYGRLVEWREAAQCRSVAAQAAADAVAETRAAAVEDARSRLDAEGALSLSEEALTEAREAGDAGRIEAAEADVHRAREDVQQHGAVRPARRPGDGAMVFDADASAEEAE